MDLTQRQAADRQIIAVLVCLGVALFLHFAGMGSTILNLAQEAMDPNGIFVLLRGGGAALTDEEMGERVGRATAFLLCGAYSMLGMVWIPVSAYGVYTRKPWGRVSALVYFGTTIPTCSCTVMGAYGLYALLRSDVKELFEERRA